MREAGVAGGLLLWGILFAGVVHAGIYSTSERWIGPKVNPSEFFLERANLRGAGVELSNRLMAACWTVTSGMALSGPGLPLSFVPNTAAQVAFLPEGPTPGWRYLLPMAELEQRERRGLLSRDEQIDLSALYLRLGLARKAIPLLEMAAREHRHFMILANLATAYEQEGLLERAVSYRQLALASWPSLYPGWDSGLVHFARRAEKAHLQLAQLRLQEAQRGTGGGMTRVDALFPRVQFLGPGGQYEAGNIAPAHGEDLTEDAFNLVMQLVLWMPFDDRLYWLFGEMLNARGDVVPAFTVLNELVTKRGDPRSLSSGASAELRRHWQVLARAADITQKLGEKVMAEDDPLLMLRYAFAVKPRGIPGVPVAGELAAATDLAAASLARKDVGRTKSATANPPPPVPGAAPDWMPQWRQIAVGFVFGAIVALLAAQQYVRRGVPEVAPSLRRRRSRMDHEPPLVIGWKEYVAFPEWGVRRIKVKIDTGARTSALDAASCELYEADGRTHARLRLGLNRRRPGRMTVIEVPVLDIVTVRCSNGTCERRPLIEAEMCLGPVRKRIRLTVTNRATMRFRMILGRHALAGDFVVDVGRKYLLRSRVKPPS